MSGSKAKAKALPAKLPSPSHEFEPLFSATAAEDAESHYNQSFGVKRRAMLVVLSRSKAQMVESFGKTADGEDGLLLTLEWLHDYREHLLAFAELADIAAARLLVVGSVLAERETQTGKSAG